MTAKFKATGAWVAILGINLMLSACHKDPQPTENQAQTSSVEDVIGQLTQTPIQPFPATADDAHDIAILEDYDRRYTDMSDQMEMELAKMQQANTLTPEFEQQRQKDNINSALTMLKELELKTEQGHYIQGLLYEYWANQAKILTESTTSNSAQPLDTTKQINNLNGYLHAQNQLQHWKNTATSTQNVK